MRQKEENHSEAAIISDGKVQNTEEKLNAAYKYLVVTQIFSNELQQTLKDLGLDNYALFCDVINDSLDLLNEKVTDQMFIAKGVV